MTDHIGGKTVEGRKITDEYVFNEFLRRIRMRTKFEFEVEDVSQISDGYHTFDELYFHRMIMFAVICKVYGDKAWKSQLHHDGTMYNHYFIVGHFNTKGAVLVSLSHAVLEYFRWS